MNGGFNQLFKVSPGAQALGVGGCFSAAPSTLSEGFIPAEGIGEAAKLLARQPTWSARFDLRDWSVILHPA